MVSMNKTDFARRLAWSIAALSVTLTVAGVAIGLLALVQSNSQQWLPVHLWFSPLSTVTFALVGALIASRQPRNPIGWICNAVAVSTGLTLFAFGYRMLSLSGRVTLPGIEFTRWLEMWLWIPATLLPLTFLLLLFPDGRLPSARWRPIGWSAGVGLAAYILSVAFHPRPTIEPNPAPNPFGIPGVGGALDLLGIVANIFVTVGAVGSIAALVVRFRRSRGIEREQLKWLTYAGVLAILGNIAIYGWYAARSNDPLAFDLMLIGLEVALTAIALAAGIAILRYRLYDIDLVINRTLVYGALTAAVAGIYLLVVGGLGVLLQARGSLALSLLGVGLVAIVAQPVRARIQRLVNRWMYGERDDPYAVLSRLSQRLESTLAPNSILPTIVETVAAALKLPYAAIILRDADADRVAAAFGLPTANTVVLPLAHQHELIGHLHVAQRSANEPFTPAEQRLLGDIARQIGLAAHNVRLTVDLQRSRERLVTTREEERRRLRRDLHDELGPSLASQTLKLDAALDLLQSDPAAAAKLLTDVKAQSQSTVADIRRVIYELRPPALDELGVVAALRAHAGLYNSVNGLRIQIESPPEGLPPLSAAVEVAAYHIAVEALANVVRHARARECCIRFSPGDPARGGRPYLQLEIADDGIGLPDERRAGVGLFSMRERAEELGGACLIERRAEGRTRVTAKLPINGQAP